MIEIACFDKANFIDVFILYTQIYKISFFPKLYSLQ